MRSLVLVIDISTGFLTKNLLFCVFVGGSKIFILDLRFLDPNGAKNSLGRPFILNVNFSRKNILSSGILFLVC